MVLADKIADIVFAEHIRANRSGCGGARNAFLARRFIYDFVDCVGSDTLVLPNVHYGWWDARNWRDALGAQTGKYLLDVPLKMPSEIIAKFVVRSVVPNEAGVTEFI